MFPSGLPPDIRVGSTCSIAAGDLTQSECPSTLPVDIRPEATPRMGLKGVDSGVDACCMFGFPGTSVETYSSLCDEDQQLISALQACGADMSIPRHVLHYIETPTEATALRMADLGAAWEVSISPPTEVDDTWFVVFEREDRVLSPTNVLADRHLFETMASVHRSSYEGWEACV